MIRESYTQKGNLLNRHVVCPHCLKPGTGRLKLNRFCPQCGEAIHRPCQKSTAPAHRRFISHLAALRRQGVSPGQVFPQLCDWPKSALIGGNE